MIVIRQDFKYKGDDRWQWWIWMDGLEDELDQIERVVYTLHHTFPNPVRTVTDRASKFRLETVGWGIFRIRAKVFFRDQTVKDLTHDLELRYPDGTQNLR